MDVEDANVSTLARSDKEIHRVIVICTCLTDPSAQTMMEDIHALPYDAMGVGCTRLFTGPPSGSPSIK